MRLERDLHKLFIVDIRETQINIQSTIFIDMIAPNWPRAIRKLARVFSRDHRNTLGY